MDKNSYRRNQRCYERWERGEVLTPKELKWADAYFKKLYQRKLEYVKYKHSRRLQNPPKVIHPLQALPEPPNVPQPQAIPEEPCEELHWGDTYDPDGILEEEDPSSCANQFLEWGATMWHPHQPMPHPSQLYHQLWLELLQQTETHRGGV